MRARRRRRVRLGGDEPRAAAPPHGRSSPQPAHADTGSKMFTGCATPNALASYVRHRFSKTTRAIFDVYYYYYTAPDRYEIIFCYCCGANIL